MLPLAEPHYSSQRDHDLHSSRFPFHNRFLLISFYRNGIRFHFIINQKTTGHIFHHIFLRLHPTAGVTESNIFMNQSLQHIFILIHECLFQFHNSVQYCCGIFLRNANTGYTKQCYRKKIFHLLLRFIHIDHPVKSVFVYPHTETMCPECFLCWHSYSTTFC